jgi:ribonuclease E
VIDFIDMESNGHIRKVERAMKEALKNDRARIQVGRISSFGLMEMSRQRLRTGVLEASTRPCPHCDGSGLMRTASSAGLSALRMLEDEAARGRGSRIILRAGREAAVYVLNRKRNEIGEIEARYGVIVEVLIDDSFEGAKMTVEALGPPPLQRPRFDPIIEPEVDEVDDLVDEDEDEEEEEEREEPAEESEGERDRNRKRRRRRGRRGGKRREGEAREGGEHEHEHERHVAEGDAQPAEEGGEPDEAIEQVAAPVAEEAPTEAGQEQPRRARRRPRARRGDAPAEVTPVEAVEAAAEVAPEAEIAAEIAPEPVAETTAAPEALAEPVAEEAPKPKRSRRRKADVEVAEGTEAPPQAANDEDGAKPKRRRTRKAPEAVEAVAAAAEVAPEPPAPDVPTVALAKVPEPELELVPAQADKAEAPPAAPAPAPTPVADNEGADPNAPPRRGWWQRTFGA